MFVVTALMAYLIWGSPDLRSLVFLGSLIFLTQLILRMRYRNSVKCPHCGFDPLLYKQNPAAAAERVKARMEDRKDNPAFLLSPKPMIKPIIEKKENWRPPNRELLPVEPETPETPTIEAPDSQSSLSDLNF